MKINGKSPSAYVVIIAIPREDGDIIFQAKALLSYEKFDQLCPKPVPPAIVKPGGEKSVDFEDKNYKLRVEEFARLKTAYMILESLSATPGLEWEKVKPNDPGTWLHWEEELKGANFSEQERIRIMNGCFEAQGLDQDKIEEARKRFLASQVVKA